MAREERSVYPIGVVEKLTGLTGRRIRYYEQAGLIHPVRSEGNQRLYTPSDVARLREIKRLLEMGLNLAAIRARLGAEGEEETAFREPSVDEELLEESDVRTRWTRDRTLRSLYPVSNRAELEKVIEEFEGGEEGHP